MESVVGPQASSGYRYIQAVPSPGGIYASRHLESIVQGSNGLDWQNQHGRKSQPIPSGDQGQKNSSIRFKPVSRRTEVLRYS
jgi:hypothetical protein